MKKAHAIVLVLVSAVLSHLLAPAIAWAQFKVQSAALTITSASGLSGGGTTDSPLAFTGTTTAAISTSAAVPQYACSKTDATCQLNSATADGTTSTTVGAITLKSGADISAADLVLDVQDSAGAHIFKVTEAGAATAAGAVGSALTTGAALFTGTGGVISVDGAVTTGGTIYSAASSTLICFNIASAGKMCLSATALTPYSAGAIALGSTAIPWNGVVSTSNYVQGFHGAGAPTGTDCDAAGESGRMFTDTTNNRFYFCNGAAWQYVNKDVP